MSTKNATPEHGNRGSVVGTPPETSMTNAHHPDLANPIGWLRCTCCGGSFYGRQFHNQDIGHGLGDCCVEYVKPRVEDMERTYGVSGVHYNAVNPNKLVQYRVRVGYQPEGTVEKHSLGEWTGSATSEEEARRLALNDLWDDRLDSASCAPWAEATALAL
jgi:hypothetical protein